MHEHGLKTDTDDMEKRGGDLASDAETARRADGSAGRESRLRIRPINVFELARKVYSSKKTSLRTHKLFRS